MENFVGIFLLSVHGLAVIFVLERWIKMKFGEILAIASSFLVGSVWITWFLSLQSFFKLSWSREVLYVDLFIAVTLAGMWVWGKRQSFIASLKHRHNKIDFAIVVAILFSLWILLWSTELRHEFVHSDSQNYWFLRATIFYSDSGVSVERLSSLPFTDEVADPRGGDFPPMTFIPVQYPLLVPLSIDYVYFILGGIHVIQAKYLWLGVEWSIALLLYAVARSCFPNTRKLHFLPIALFYLIPNTFERFGIHVFGFADVWLGGFWLIAIWSIYLGYIHSRLNYSLLGLVGICGVLMTKIEGMTGLWLVPLLLYQFRNFRAKWQVWVVGFVLLSLSVFWYIESNGIQPHGFIQKTITEISQGKSDFSQWPSTIFAFLKDLVTITTHGLVWWLFFPLYLFLIKKRKLPFMVGWLWLSVWLGLGSTLFVYLTMEVGPLTTPMSFIISGTLTRYAVQWYPTALSFLMLGYALIAIKSRKQSSLT